MTFLTLLCVVSLLQPVSADDVEARIRQQEARLIYESASRFMDAAEYDKAIRRFDMLSVEYPETEYARLAENRKSEAANLKLTPGPISGMSRASLVGFGTLFTTWLGFGSWILSDSREPEIVGVILILAPLGGLAGSMKLTQNMRLSDGQASLINLGGVWGIWQATGAAFVADVDDDGIIGASMAGGVIGLAISGSIARNRYITPGDATMINFGGIWGTWFALCGAMLANLEDDDDILLSSMLGGDVGLFTAAALLSKLEISRSRARLINLGGVIGTLYGLGANVLFEIDSKRDFWSVLGIGSILGLAAGTYFTRNYDLEEGYFAKAVINSVPTTDISAIAPRRTDSRRQQASGMDLRMPLLSIAF